MSSDQHIDTSNCTEVTPECPVSATLYGDYFSTGGCAFFVAAYSAAILGQVFFAWRSKAWSYAAYLGIGSIFELIGYVSRLRMSFNPFVNTAFILQILFLILAPTLVAASISLTFKHLVLYYGSEFSTIRPRLYPWVFVGSDFVSIVIQGIGGAIAASASVGEDPDPSQADLGNNLLIAGVSFQVVNMAVCGFLMLIYVKRYRKVRNNGSVRSNTHRDQDKQVKRFIWSIVVAYIAIIIRCIYRIPEMASGWGSDLMQNETSFLILDGAMILLAVTLLTVFHPHLFFPFLSKKPPGFGAKEETIQMGN